MPLSLNDFMGTSYTFTSTDIIETNGVFHNFVSSNMEIASQTAQSQLNNASVSVVDFIAINGDPSYILPGFLS